MKSSDSIIYPFFASLLFAVSAVQAQVTAINNGYHEWGSAEWTAGVPMGDATAFLNDNTHVNLSDGSTVSLRGVRIGNVTSSTAKLNVDKGLMELSYVVVGNSPNSNALYYQSGGMLNIADTQYIDFDIGSGEGPATAPCTSQAVFEGGTANLADVRFNLSSERSNSLVINGSAIEISANLLTAEPKGTSWQKGTLEFNFDRRGISTLKVDSGVVLGEKDKFILKVDGSDYVGNKSRFVLIEAGYISGQFAEIVIEGFEEDASVYAEDNNIVLTIP